MLAQGRQGFGQRVDDDRAARLRAPDAQHAVGEQADRQHMVEMRMADQHMINARQLVEREVPTPVPASMSTVPSSRNDVVLQPAAMAPEQPRTRMIMSFGRVGPPQFGDGEWVLRS